MRWNGPWYWPALTITPPVWPPVAVADYQVGPTTLYVHRGIGMEGGNAPRVRFCARPEVAVIDLVPL